ncbi:uncharacterized protein Tco025E_00509 [Trypanosoma conorhini]|uniref:Uncharacterized protein n=1 Tax=Trypanosoma conorhini TaxID=83891 RepID=A0A422QBI5_9TRYP|nr:uncharacterized protein Tco025E_00509 [Trypanosoma conorhini]RNF27317.1 hypothetical protein Tco025E_00509 [Trypanosoma conorhini]
MRGSSPAPSCDSAENIYNLLCAVQAQANADEEEVKARRLRITNYESETERVREEVRGLSEQQAKACEEVNGQRLRVEEQRLRHAGAAELLDRTKQEVAEVVGALFACEVPLHSAAAAAAAEKKEPPQELLPPAVLRGAMASLKQKINVATERQRRRGAEARCTFSTADANGDDTGHPFTVRFRRESVPVAAPSPFPANDAAVGAELTGEGETSFLSMRPRRKFVTFNDAQLEVHAEKPAPSSPDAAALPRAHVAASEAKEEPAAAASCGVLNMRRTPRRTMWKKEPRHTTKP